jgi:hypothetical protein
LPPELLARCSPFSPDLCFRVGDRRRHDIDAASEQIDAQPKQPWALGGVALTLIGAALALMLL